jgi:DNA-binding CsgD family transcriptional regulator
MVPSHRLVNEGGRLIRNGIDSILARLTKPARATGWVIGLFASDGDLLDFVVSSAQVPRRRAMDLLCAVPIPDAPRSVVLKITGEDGKVADHLSAAAQLDGARYLALVLTRPHTTDVVWLRISKNLKDAFIQIVAAASTESDSVGGPPATKATSDESAFFLLTPERQIAFASQNGHAPSSEFAKTIAPRGGRLPPLLERCVERLTKSWDFSRVESCRAVSGNPMPGVAVRIEPMAGNGIAIAVHVTRVSKRHPLADAVAAYRLSPREREVLAGLLDGRSVADIAAMLKIAESTVSDHIGRMIVKTNAHNRVELAALVLGWPALRSHLKAHRPRVQDGVTESPADRAAESLPSAAHTNGETSGRVSWRYKIRSPQ